MGGGGVVSVWMGGPFMRSFWLGLACGFGGHSRVLALEVTWGETGLLGKCKREARPSDCSRIGGSMVHLLTYTRTLWSRDLSHHIPCPESSAASSSSVCLSSSSSTSGLSRRCCASSRNCCAKCLRLIKELAINASAYIATIIGLYGVDVIQILASGLLMIASFAASYDMDIDVAFPKLTFDVTISLPKWAHWLPDQFSKALDGLRRVFGKINISTVFFQNIELTCDGGQAPAAVRRPREQYCQSVGVIASHRIARASICTLFVFGKGVILVATPAKQT